MNSEKLKELQDKSRGLPFEPGVYIMKDASGHIIYIGKAKALRRRVSQYFLRFDHHEGKVRKMVEHVDHFDYIITDSEFEALVLECSLIKQHKPKYNILLKDDKGYSYIRITMNEKWPRIESAKKKEEDGALYLGPYISSFAVKEAVDEAIKAFSLPTCSRNFEKDIGRGRPCLNYFIHQCCAPCRGRMTNEEYRECVESAVSFLKGGYDKIIKELTARMENLAENLEFEKAARIRDRITAIKKIRERQKVVASKVEEQDVIALASDGCNTDFEVFIIRSGRLTDRESYLLDFIADEKAARAEFLRRYYSPAKLPPARVTLDGETEDKALLEEYLTKAAGRKVSITIPQKGEQAALAAMVKNNAQEKIGRLSQRPEKSEKVLDELGNLLGLSRRPEYIESYDISNTAGTGVVAGMVVFEGGRPLKSAYRKFSIKTVDGQDDYACMREVVGRRLARLREAVDSGETAKSGFSKIPDLILLDGGRGHVGAVRPVLEEYGFDIPLFGMVKDDKHRTRAIAANGGEIAINESRSVFTLVSQIQDEVHRFAISYHHKTQGHKAFSSRLTQIPGIGEGRAKSLMKHFKTMEKIRNATEEELAKAPGMTKPAASMLFEWLKNNK
ncbi:MAG TPA: excinuclease ABC subunit UvrC [Ruminiclostridium sp.]|nr:excinuclease ABC subunit UvrC [Ruminiclostridium sp.]